MKPTILSIIGKPLSGKDTQADLFVAAHPDSVKISPGEIIREVRAVGETHRFWPLIGPHIPMMESGLKLPDEPTLAMLGHVMHEKLAEGAKMIVIAGSPRGLMQLDGFKHLAQKEGAAFIVVHIDVIDQETYRRSATRREGRIDDVPHVHSVRLNEYKKFVLPVIETLRREGNIVQLDGMQSKDTVFGELQRKVDTRLKDPEITLPAMARR